MSDTEWTNLRNILTRLPPGPIEDTKELEGALARCWEDLTGGDEGGMEGGKLFGRMEEAE